MTNQTCVYCGQTFKNNSLFKHVNTKHQVTTKEYFDQFLKKPNEDKCIICSNTTNFYRHSYNKCCSKSCAAIYRQLHSNHNQKIETFEKTHNCTSIVKLRNIYGQGWYKAKLFNDTDYIKSNFNSIVYFLPNSKIQIIEDYAKNHTYCGKSRHEKLICNFLKTLDIKFEQNIRSIIAPKELDIYIPELKLAIEYNGIWFHSIENGCSENYHLSKSIACRDQHIRLIHIYEFEDLAIQLKLLKYLIDGKDNYFENDFNKNNLIKQIPKSQLIYTSNRNYHIYGAGPLFKEYDI